MNTDQLSGTNHSSDVAGELSLDYIVQIKHRGQINLSP